MSNQAIGTSKRPGYGSAANYEKGLSAIARDHLPIGTKITPRWLEDQDIPPSDAPPVLYAYRFMRIVDEHDGLTEKGLGLAQATGESKQALLRANLEDAYSDAFHRIKPPYASIQQLRDAFRDCQYEPVAMQGKMVSLFRGLCRAAGITLDEHETAQASRKQTSETHSPTSQGSPTLDTLHLVEGNPFMAEPLSPPQLNGSAPTSGDARAEELGEFLTRLLQLPKSPGWTEANREWWRQAVSVNIEQIQQALKGHGGMKR